MPFLKFSKSPDTSKRSDRPSLGSGSGSTSRYANIPHNGIYSSHSHSPMNINEPSQSYNTYSDYTQASRHVTSSHDTCGNSYQRMDVSPIRESTYSHGSSSVYGERPVSPLGTSRFEQPSPWSNRRAPSARPRAYTVRDEHGFSIRKPSRSQGNSYGMSAHAPLSTDEYEHFEPRERPRGYTEAAPSQSRRSDTYGASRSSSRAYNMQSDFRNGGFSDWMNY